MTAPLDPQRSAQHIRRRLFRLLIQAFAIVVSLTVLLLIGLLSVLAGVVTDPASGIRPGITRELEAYYLGHGSWEGVDQLLPRTGQSANELRDWRQVVLLDTQDRVLLDTTNAGATRVGQVLPPDSAGRRVPVTVNGQTVGYMIFGLGTWHELRALLPGILVPTLFITFFTGVLTLIIGVLLTRRVVMPLADVIAAAQSVAAGDLSARAQVGGPGDLRTLSDNFNRMAGALQASDRQRRDLLADIAHELRTPLTIIRGRLEGILDGIYPADTGHVAPVLEETYVLERLVEDLRLLTLAETRQLHFDLQPLDLGELAQRTAGLFEAEAGERQISLSVSADLGLPPVQADSQRVGQVLGNLLSNALRFANPGDCVTIRVQPAPSGVEVVVADTGPGVPEAELPHLFDRFWRSERSRTRAAGGAGLGLAIAKQLIEAQSGTIQANNQTTGGLEVSFILPTAVSTTKAPSPGGRGQG
jgi:two-component system OmpR family sensor kinase/two-component system sensor histidine kinase BaeS